LPKKIRVYELARELGLTNKEALDLCIALGIGVKSHSSSIEDQQADRVRRKADRDGLRRDVQPEEPAEPAKAKPGRAGKVAAEPVELAADTATPAQESELEAPDVALRHLSPVAPPAEPLRETIEAPAAASVVDAPAAKAVETDLPAAPSRTAEGTARPVDPRLITSRPEHAASSPSRPARADESGPVGPPRQPESAGGGGHRGGPPPRPPPQNPSPTRAAPPAIGAGRQRRPGRPCAAVVPTPQPSPRLHW
jgi:translation initiation factor IF-2